MKPAAAVKNEPRASGGYLADDPDYIERLKAALGEDYALGALIGQGGFGRVYRGEDGRLGRPVAIKAIRPELAGARVFVDRMRKEGTTLATFRHPGIIPIYDIREHDGVICYIMPLIEGDTVRARLDRSRALAPKMAHRVLTELAECLAATHRAGIVHRDVKPDNVILEGALGRALLMDFGIAKHIQDFGDTGTGMIMGTPAYMSPEQARAEAEVDHRSDLYSLGVLGYHMLTGRPPFVGASAHSVITAHIGEDAVPVRKLNPSVPSILAAAIEKCMAKDPADRYQSAADLGADLAAVTFAADAEPIIPSEPNVGMIFFAGTAAEAMVFAAFTRHDWMWYVAGGFALISVLLSPVVRASTEPLNDVLTSKLAALRARFRS